METENNITGVEFLSDLNVLLSTSVGLNRNVKLALKKLGEHERADQVYIVSINHDMTFTISEEWTRTGESVLPESREKRSFYYDRKLEQNLEFEEYHAGDGGQLCYIFTLVYIQSSFFLFVLKPLSPRGTVVGGRDCIFGTGGFRTIRRIGERTDFKKIGKTSCLVSRLC